MCFKPTPNHFLHKSIHKYCSGLRSFYVNNKHFDKMQFFFEVTTTKGDISFTIDNSNGFHDELVNPKDGTYSFIINKGESLYVTMRYKHHCGKWNLYTKGVE